MRIPSLVSFTFAGLALAGSAIAQSCPAPALVASHDQPGGADGPVTFTHRGVPAIGGDLPRFVLDAGTPSAPGSLLIGATVVPIPINSLGVTLLTVPVVSIPFALDASGDADLDLLPGTPLPPSLCGGQLVLQAALLDPRPATGLYMTDALQVQFGETPADPTFGGQQTPAGQAPTGLVAGDLNGDSVLDLVIPEGNGANVLVFLGDGRGRFTQSYSSPTGASPTSASIGDFDADGVLDFAVSALNGGTVSVFLGNGDGTFVEAPNLVVARPRDLEVADVTGDGNLDIVVSNSIPSQLLVFAGQGDGSFVALPAVPLVIALGDALEVGDLNGDRALDVALLPGSGTPDNRMIIMLNDGAGGFAATAAGAFSPGTASVSRGTLADLDNDGDLDVVVCGPFDGNIAVHLNDGNAEFSAPVVTNVVAGSSIPVRAANAADAVASDFDDDGFLDLAVASTRSDQVLILLGRGDGSFDQGQFLGSGDLTAHLIVIDANGDGEEDLIATNVGSDDFSVFFGQGGGAFDGPSAVPAGRGVIDLDVAELTGDGLPDIVTADLLVGTLSVLPSVMGGGFDPVLTVVASGQPTAVVAADVTGDGRPDLVYVDQLNHLLGVCRSLGGSAYSAAEQFSTGEGTAPIGVALGDFDGDGLTDAVVANRTADSLGLLFGVGNGLFGAVQQIALNAGEEPRDVQVADLDDDGVLDLVAVTDPGENLVIALGMGNGSFAPLQRIAIGGRPEDVAVGDLDDDGVLDIAVAGVAASALVLFGQGDGSFGAPMNLPGSFIAPFSVSIGDVDGDGRPDLGVLDSKTQSVNVYRNAGLGNGSLAAPEKYSIDILQTRFTTGLASSLALRDLDGDQQVDIAATVSAGFEGGVVSVDVNRRPSLINP